MLYVPVLFYFFMSRGFPACGVTRHERTFSRLMTSSFAFSHGLLFFLYAKNRDTYTYTRYSCTLAHMIKAYQHFFYEP